MTVSSTVSKVIYAGNDSTVAFPVSFTFVLSSDLVVQLKDAEAVYTTLTETTHYTVSGAGDANGGTVTMLTAPATGETLIIYRDPQLVQEVDYQENDAFPAETHEAALDLLTMIAQANRERIGRAIKLPVSSGLTDIEVAEPEASRVLVWNADEDALENGPTTTEIGNAQTYATNALASATAASASETNAGNSATAAATSAAAALASETAADTSETNAASSAAAALASETAAETSEINAAASAAAALASETAASTSATNAASSASSALSSKNAAATSASNAASSATAAATSAADAATSEADAANSATAADTAKTGAEAAQTGAETAATNASNSATAAATSASNAATSATNAGNSATASAASASSAAGSAGTAATAATNAASSASDASDDADLSQAWAEGTEPGGTGTKSAKEWAEEAEAIAAANAAGIPYDNSSSGLDADDVQEAIDELVSEKLDTSGNLPLGQVTGAGTAAGYDVGAGADQLPTNSLLNVLSVGSVFLAPDGDLVSTVLECDGSAVSRTTYHDLFLGVGAVAPALGSATHTDVKGSITQLVVDTADTSGHFNAAAGTSVLAWCRMVIAGTDYDITAIANSGTSANEVEFSGTLAAGTYTVTAIYGTDYDSGGLGLSGSVTYGPDITSGETCSASQNTSDANKLVDDNLTNYWRNGTADTAWWQIQFSTARQIAKVVLYADAAKQKRMPSEWTLSASNTGAFAGEEVLVATISDPTAYASSEIRTFTFDPPSSAYTYYRINMTDKYEDLGFDYEYQIAELEMMEVATGHPTGVFYPVILPAVDDADVPDIESAIATEDADSQTVVFAVSFDGGTTWKAWDGDSWETVVLTSETGWMTSTTLESIADADWPTVTQDTYWAVGFKTTVEVGEPVLTQLKVQAADSAESMPIGATFGEGDGESTFNLPALTGSAPTGLVYVIKF